MTERRVSMSKVGLAAVAVAAAVAGYFYVKQTGDDRARAAATAPPPPVPVRPATAQRQDMPVFVRGIGTVQAYNMVVVKTRVDGAIVKVSFQEGQEVKAGDPLFQIDPRPFQAALDKAQAAKDRSEAQLTGAQLDLGRYSTLSGEGYQSRQSFDEQTAIVNALKARIAAEEAAMTDARLNLVYADIRAPIDGRTGRRLVDIGNLVQAAQATSLVSIAQIKPIYVSFTVPQDVNDQVRGNQAAGALTVIAYASDDRTELARGKLSVIDNQIDTTTGTIRLKATFDNADERLWPGQFVNVRLVLSTRPGATTVPQEAIMQGGAGYYAWLVRPDGTAERRNVEIAGSQDGVALVDRGIQPGETVAVFGQERLTNGARVRLVSPAPAAAAPVAPTASAPATQAAPSR